MQKGDAKKSTARMKYKISHLFCDNLTFFFFFEYAATTVVLDRRFLRPQILVESAFGNTRLFTGSEFSYSVLPRKIYKKILAKKIGWKFNVKFELLELFATTFRLSILQRPCCRAQQIEWVLLRRWIRTKQKKIYYLITSNNRKSHFLWHIFNPHSDVAILKKILSLIGNANLRKTITFFA